MTVFPDSVRIVEVGPRDGLQNEANTVPTADKAKFIKLLADAGLHEIEVASFVHPKWVPQLADAKELGLRLYACTGAMAIADIRQEHLRPEVDETIGLGVFLEIARSAAINWYI